MKFCDKCGSYMQGTSNGFKCSRCGNAISTPIVEIKQITPSESAINVISETEQNYRKVAKICPRCGNSEAFSNPIFSSGEHAGVRQERSLERLTCTKCKYSWTED